VPILSSFYSTGSLGGHSLAAEGNSCHGVSVRQLLEGCWSRLWVGLTALTKAGCLQKKQKLSGSLLPCCLEYGQACQYMKDINRSHSEGHTFMLKEKINHYYMNYIFSWMCISIRSMCTTGTLSKTPHHFSNLKKLPPGKWN